MWGEGASHSCRKFSFYTQRRHKRKTENKCPEITMEFHVYSYRSNHGKQPTIPPPFVSFITFLLLTFLLHDIYPSLVIMF